MAEDSLNHDVWHTEAVEVAPKAPPCSMPSMPLSDALVSLVLVVCVNVFRLRLATNLAARARCSPATISAAVKDGKRPADHNVATRSLGGNAHACFTTIILEHLRKRSLQKAHVALPFARLGKNEVAQREA